ncbi:hypothetical protein P4C99_14825 [Pontiellaceae bacterium B1224]|nr:hypothetical protein [Pontiellaceae bacterium B1224]
MESVDQALLINAENATGYALKALILVHMHRVNDARKCIDESLRLNPDLSRSHAVHGWVLLREKENKRSLESFKLSLQINPKERVALKGLREALMKNSSLFYNLSSYSTWLTTRPLEKIERLIQLQFYLFLTSLILLLIAGGPRIFAQWAIIPQLIFAFLNSSKEDLPNFVMIFHSFGRWSVPPREKMLSTFAVIHALITVGMAWYGAFAENAEWSISALGALLYFIPLNCLKKNPERPAIWFGLIIVLVLGLVGILSVTEPFLPWIWCTPYVWACLMFRRILEAIGCKPLTKPLSIEERKRYRSISR